MKSYICLALVALFICSYGPIAAQSFNSTAVRVYLEGALVGGGGTMRNDLQTKGLLPVASTAAYPGDPLVVYNDINNPSGPAGAIVDWVRVSLRNVQDPSIVLETLICLLRRDGYLVTESGSTMLPFTLPAGDYYLSVQHRNHLGVMTGMSIPLSQAPNGNLVDFTSPATANYGTSPAAAANAQFQNSGVRSLWAGNVEITMPGGGGHQVIYYAGTPSDVDLLRATVTNAAGNILHLTTFSGASMTNLYSVFDINLDGNIRYSASPSDVDLIRANVTNFPANILHLTTFTGLIEQLP